MKTIFVLLITSLFFFSLHGNNFSESGREPWGVDAELTHPRQPHSTSSHTVCTKLIRFFQVYISPIDGPRSSFYPTSSQYALDAIEKYGVFKGIALGCDRLMRENKDPWHYEITHDYGIDRKLNHVR
ncbi:MAG: putative membrane protein insertion efficiency factor [Chlamydiales bacterium]|nr:putative membrane protein insertion efficiency factor [Chlamydiales bacterium]MCH9619659.1 putative membrane protein insertion efficiency factor [Chlamydiales bacterium]MCH9623265.1 putative membrane protein insertion efficiency factor [Chlamydiales bacterium]